jgi:hypothetical protein
MPPEFDFADEKDFTLRYVMPVLQSTGFSVVYYHGNSEFGRDIILAEVDRLGHLNYHGVQVKFEPTIGLADVDDLISDCHQAFANPFLHPQTGASERIGVFYVVNAGSISEQARQHFFNSVLPKFGANAGLLQGQDLLLIARGISSIRLRDMRARLNGFRREIRHNQKAVEALGKDFYTDYRLRHSVSEAYLAEPLGPELDDDFVEYYWTCCTVCNRMVDVIIAPLMAQSLRESAKAILSTSFARTLEYGAKLEEQIQRLLARLGEPSL